MPPVYGQHVGGINGDGACVVPYSRPNTLFEIGDTATTSHNVEVRPGEAWVIQAQGLSDDDCLAVEVVSGCGPGSFFTPYSLGCGCPVTLCDDRQRIVIPYPGRYRVVVSRGTPGDYRVTAYMTHDNTVSPSGAAMGCGCNDSPVQVIASIANDANAMLLLCNALRPCIEQHAPAAVLPGPDVIVQTIADDTSALAALCAALSPCFIETIRDQGDTLVHIIFDDVTAKARVCLEIQPCIDARVTEFTSSPTYIDALCSALAPCVDARVANYFTQVTNVNAICSALEPCIDARVANYFTSVTNVNATCSALTPCIDGLIDAAFAASTGSFYVAKITSDGAAMAALCSALVPCIVANAPGGGGGGLTSVAVTAPITGNGTAGSPVGIDVIALVGAVCANGAAKDALADCLVSPTAGNQLTSDGNGLYVPAPPASISGGFSGGQFAVGSYTVFDTPPGTPPLAIGATFNAAGASFNVSNGMGGTPHMVNYGTWRAMGNNLLLRTA